MRRSIFKGSLAALLMLSALVWTALASAVPVFGTFTLVADITAGSPLSGQTVASGTFDFDDANLVSSFTDPTSGTVFVNTVALDSLVVTDLTGGLLSSIVFADFTVGPVAVLSGPTTSSTVLGLFGSTDLSTIPQLQLSFDQANAGHVHITKCYDDSHESERKSIHSGAERSGAARCWHSVYLGARRLGRIVSALVISRIANDSRLGSTTQ